MQDLESKLLQDGMKPKGVEGVHNVLSGAMKQALRLELIVRNPVALVSPPTVSKSGAYIPEVSQVQALLAMAEAEGHPLWVCIHVIAYTGMRRGEALALEWKHVDLDNLRILVAQSLVGTTAGVVLEPPKTEDGQRIVDLDKVTAEVLRTHRDHQRALAARLGISPSAKLFPRNDQVGWTHPNTVRYALRTLGKRAGCPSITLRSLRHFHASVTLQAGQNPVVVSKRIGHSSPIITMDVYAHALSRWQQDAAEAFAEVMKPAA